MAPKYYGKGCYFSIKPRYSDNEYAYKIADDKLKKEIRQLLLCRVVVGKFNFGLNALHLDQMRTLSKSDLATFINNAIKKQNKNKGGDKADQVI